MGGVRHLAECGGKGLAVPRPCRRSGPRSNGERPCRCPWCGEEARIIRELEVRLAVVREVPRSSWLAGSPRISFGRTGNEWAVTNLRWYGVVGEGGQVMAGGTQKHAEVRALGPISPSRSDPLPTAVSLARASEVERNRKLSSGTQCPAWRSTTELGGVCWRSGTHAPATGVGGGSGTRKLGTQRRESNPWSLQADAEQPHEPDRPRAALSGTRRASRAGGRLCGAFGSLR
jgi:hypothetical protein